jgi:hypothetical protein
MFHYYTLAHNLDVKRHDVVLSSRFHFQQENLRIIYIFIYYFHKNWAILKKNPLGGYSFLNKLKVYRIEVQRLGNQIMLIKALLWEIGHMD